GLAGEGSVLGSSTAVGLAAGLEDVSTGRGGPDVTEEGVAEVAGASDSVGSAEVEALGIGEVAGENIDGASFPCLASRAVI
ncbi:hypothetical protein, partial [Frankia sp. EI5c]|uniref:hypothetical protein n=1 Tax=Frankia sp. EI5c TaxID=683316 RepID=UPI001F5B0397